MAELTEVEERRRCGRGIRLSVLHLRPGQFRVGGPPFGAGADGGASGASPADGDRAVRTRKVQVTPEHHRAMRFDRWRADLPSFTSLSLYRLRPMKGGVLAMIEPEFVTSMIDAFYGGSGTAVKHRARGFTPTNACWGG